jgi:hypothetical protein
MLDPRTVTVGLDVHKSSVRLAAVSQGELLREVTLPFDHAVVERELRAWPAARVCMEAGPTGFGLQRHLTAAGIDRLFGVARGDAAPRGRAPKASQSHGGGASTKRPSANCPGSGPETDANPGQFAVSDARRPALRSQDDP